MNKSKLMKFITLTVLLSNFICFYTAAAEKKSNAQANDQLINSLRAENYEGVKKAIENGADVNLKEEWKGVVHYGPYTPLGTPLIYAASKIKDPKFTKLLIDSKADIDQKDQNSRTALHNAAMHTMVDNMKLLILAGADVNSQDNSKFTPLITYIVQLPGIRHVYSSGAKADLDLIQLFLDHDVDLTLKDSLYNEGALDVVRKYKDLGNMADVLKLLQDYQEKQSKKVQEEVSKHLAPPGLADITSEYVVGPKKRQII